MSAQDLDVDDLSLIKNCEVNGLPSRASQIDHVRGRRLPEVAGPRCPLSQLEEPDSEADEAPIPFQEGNVDELLY